MKFGKITEELMKFLEESGENPDLSSIKPELMEELKKIKFIKNDIYIEPSMDNMPEKAKNPVIKNISLFISQSCNLNCLYCYGGGGEYGEKGFMDEPTAFRTIDWFIEQSEKEKKLSVSFFGGEPLLNFPLIKKTISYCEEKEKECNKKFEFFITTNGTLLSDEIISYGKEKNIGFLISFDGPKDIQDYNRPSKEGDFSSYDEAVRGIKKLLSEIPKVNVRATIYGDSDVEYVTDFLSDMGFETYHFVKASESPHNTSSEKINMASTEKIITYHRKKGKEIVEAVKKRDVDKIKKLKLSRFFHKYILREPVGRKNFFCGAARNYGAVSASGDVYPCHRFVGLKEYKIGNIYSNDLSRDDHLKPLVFTVEKCIKCPVKYFCGGNCINEHMGASGSIFEPSEDVCRIARTLSEMAVYVSAELDKSDIAWLEGEKIIPEIPCYFDF